VGWLDELPYGVGGGPGAGQLGGGRSEVLDPRKRLVTKHRLGRQRPRGLPWGGHGGVCVMMMMVAVVVTVDAADDDFSSAFTHGIRGFGHRTTWRCIQKLAHAHLRPLLGLLAVVLELEGGDLAWGGKQRGTVGTMTLTGSVPFLGALRTYS
jgi:hypothetical protein